ncbi:MAG: hypothetical protein HY751_04900 [Nitrospinae bacterium]|nr:hypothetical protein [Nitrospinota bacterium]
MAQQPVIHKNYQIFPGARKKDTGRFEAEAVLSWPTGEGRKRKVMSASYGGDYATEEEAVSAAVERAKSAIEDGRYK